MSISLDAITLPADLVLADEYAYTPVAQALTRTLGGVNVVEESELVAGRPLVLSGDEEYGWATRTTLDALRATQQTAAAAPMTLTIHGTAYDVIWQRPNPMDARPVRGPVSNPDGTERYAITLRFLTV